MLAQACLAATLDPQTANIQSFKAYFVSAGNTTEPISYEVETLRQGRNFTFKSVHAVQGGKPLLVWQGLLGTEQERRDPQQFACPEVPDPEQLPSLAQLRADHPESADGFRWPPSFAWQQHSRPFDVRYIGSTTSDLRIRCYWMRAEPAPNATQNEQRAILSFASDHSFATSISHARGDLAAGISRAVVSLDHSIWFHRDVCAGDWYLFVQQSPFNTDQLGLALGYLYDRQRRLVATVSQQVLRPAS